MFRDVDKLIDFGAVLGLTKDRRIVMKQQAPNADIVTNHQAPYADIVITLNR